MSKKALISMVVILTCLAFVYDYGTTHAFESDEIVIDGGTSQPVFSYEDAIREVVQVQSPQSSHDGKEPDIINVDIIRPAASDENIKVPTIVVPSPYYAGPGRGREGENKPDPNATPHVIAGENKFPGDLLTDKHPVIGQNGPLVECDFALTSSNCPSNTEGAIALIDGDSNMIDEQIITVSKSGAIGAVIYSDANDIEPLDSDVPIPVLKITQSDGLELKEKLLEGNVDTNLRELVDPIDFFPLFYDNFFVPRGYAIALVDLPGSRASTGCLDVGGPAEVNGTAAVIEWLAGKGKAVDGISGMNVTADWSSGKSALIGKSWDGTVPYGVAGQAPEGLKTIVPIGALSHWHSDFWDNGVRYGGSTTLWHERHNDNPSMENYCSETYDYLDKNEEDPDPNSDFWQERNFLKDVDNFEASVFLIHGKNDYNVKPVNYEPMWSALVENDVPRKMWLSQVAHEEPFDFRRDKWVNTLHRWFDYWLHDIDNGIMDEPNVENEYGPGEWDVYDNWPNGKTTHLWLGGVEDENDPRQGSLWPDARYVNKSSINFKEIRHNLNTLAKDPYLDQDYRQVFLSPELSDSLRVSGKITVTVDVGIEDQDATLSALLVDYGKDERINHTAHGNGLKTLKTKSCFGMGTEVDHGCYFDVGLDTHTSDFEVVTRGWVNSAFQNGGTFDPGENYKMTWDLQPHDYVFKEGHRFGIVITGPETHLHMDRHPTTNNNIDIYLGSSTVQLPIVGGQPALENAFGSPDLPTSANNILLLVEHLDDEGAFANNKVFRSLMTHLKAVKHYESQEKADKVVKHMDGFKALLDHQIDNDLISEDVYDTLNSQANELINKWQ